MKITQAGYALIEKRGCKVEIKKQILIFLITQSHKKDISKSRLSELLGVHRCNLDKYKGDTSAIILKEYEYRDALKKELYLILEDLDKS